MQSKNELLNKIMWLENDVENLQKNNGKFDTAREF